MKEIDIWFKSMEYLWSPEDRLPRQNQRTEASAPLKLPFRAHARVWPLMSLISFPSPRLAATSNFAWGKKMHITLGSGYAHRQAIKSSGCDGVFISPWLMLVLYVFLLHSTPSGTFCQRTCSNSSEESPTSTSSSSSWCRFVRAFLFIPQSNGEKSVLIKHEVNHWQLHISVCLGNKTEVLTWEKLLFYGMHTCHSTCLLLQLHRFFTSPGLK